MYLLTIKTCFVQQIKYWIRKRSNVGIVWHQICFDFSKNQASRWNAKRHGAIIRMEGGFHTMPLTLLKDCNSVCRRLVAVKTQSSFSKNCSGSISWPWFNHKLKADGFSGRKLIVVLLTHVAREGLHLRLQQQRQTFRPITALLHCFSDQLKYF